MSPIAVLAKLEGERDIDSKLFKIETLMVDMKRMDKTYVFITMTVSLILFTLLYTAMAYWGLVGRFPLSEAKKGGE